MINPFFLRCSFGSAICKSSLDFKRNIGSDRKTLTWVFVAAILLGYSFLAGAQTGAGGGGFRSSQAQHFASSLCKELNENPIIQQWMFRRKEKAAPLEDLCLKSRNTHDLKFSTHQFEIGLPNKWDRKTNSNSCEQTDRMFFIYEPHFLNSQGHAESELRSAVTLVLPGVDLAEVPAEPFSNSTHSLMTRTSGTHRWLDQIIRYLEGAESVRFESELPCGTYLKINRVE